MQCENPICSNLNLFASTPYDLQKALSAGCFGTNPAAGAAGPSTNTPPPVLCGKVAGIFCSASPWRPKNSTSLRTSTPPTAWFPWFVIFKKASPQFYHKSSLHLHFQTGNGFLQKRRYMSLLLRTKGEINP